MKKYTLNKHIHSKYTLGLLGKERYVFLENTKLIKFAISRLETNGGFYINRELLIYLAEFDSYEEFKENYPEYML